MATKDDGGPAFARPGTTIGREEWSEPGMPDQSGMSLRDWFAGQALSALPLSHYEHINNAAIAAYSAADAMLEARKE
jgi:hypothetical protein